MTKEQIEKKALDVYPEEEGFNAEDRTYFDANE